MARCYDDDCPHLGKEHEHEGDRVVFKLDTFVRKMRGLLTEFEVEAQEGREVPRQTHEEWYAEWQAFLRQAWEVAKR
jgi:hypothetical protein